MTRDADGSYSRGMKILKALMIASALFGTARAEDKPAKTEEGFTPLFDGKTLDGWKVGENAPSFSVQDGAIVAKGERAHLFYAGKVKDAKFKNFELRLDVMTKANSNGGVYISTAYQESGWPTQSYEVQVNNSHGDWRKSGSLYKVADNKDPFADDAWMAYVIVVKDGKISISINGKELLKDFVPKEGGSKLLPDGGTIAFQAHDPGSTVLYKNIRIKALD